MKNFFGGGFLEDAMRGQAKKEVKRGTQEPVLETADVAGVDLSSEFTDEQIEGFRQELADINLSSIDPDKVEDFLRKERAVEMYDLARRTAGRQ